MTQDAALQRLVEQAGTGQDARLVCSRADARTLLDQAAVRLADLCSVVAVTAPPAGLSLSELMAQLSGQRGLGDHDDSVLELGFSRLAGMDTAQRVVLLLDASTGLQRPVARYLQYVGRCAPKLVFVVAGGADLDASLADPGVAALRTRLAAHPPIGVDIGMPDEGTAPTATTLAALATAFAEPEPASPSRLPVTGPMVAGERLAATSRAGRSSTRRVVPWAVAGAGVAAVLTLGAWLGHAQLADGARVAERAGSPVEAPMDARIEATVMANPPAPNPEPADRGGTDRPRPAETATAPRLSAPSLAAPKPEAPKMARTAPSPSGKSMLADTVLAHAALPDVAAVAAAPPADVPSITPDDMFLLPAAPASGEPRSEAEARDRRRVEVPRPGSVAARTRGPEQRPAALRAPANRRWERAPAEPSSDPREADGFVYVEPPRYDRFATRRYWPPVDEGRFGPGPAEWQGGRAVAPERPFIGTYTAGPYGSRVFRYEQP